MKPLFRVIIAVIGIALILTCFSNLYTSSATQASHTISDLAWMSGSWRTAPGGRAQIEEHWMEPGGGSMLGMSRTVAGDRTVEFEYLRL